MTIVATLINAPALERQVPKNPMAIITEIGNGHIGAGEPWSRVDFANVAQMVAAGCRRYPSVPAVIFDDGMTIGREQLLLRARAFAGYLLRHSVKGERVAVMLENRIECMIIFIAALLTERILVTINPDSKSFDGLHVLRNSGSVIIVTSVAKEELALRLKGECPALRLILTLRDPEPDGLRPFTADGGLPQPEICQATRKSAATVYYTSGSTGLPKGCVLGHEWWLRLCDIHLRTTPVQDDYRPLCCVPFHYADSMFQLLCALHMGGTLIAMRRFSVSRFWALVAQYGVTEIYLLASMPTLLLKQAAHPLERQHKLRIAVCSPVPKTAHQNLVERFGVQFIDSYGTTEAGWNVRTPWRIAGKMVGSGSMGTAVPETVLRIVDKTGNAAAVGEIGELLVRGPGLFLGYLNDPAATCQALRDGWYHTGDLVRSDDQGLLYFIGRMNDVVRRSGETVSAAESAMESPTISSRVFLNFQSFW